MEDIKPYYIHLFLAILDKYLFLYRYTYILICVN